MKKTYLLTDEIYTEKDDMTFLMKREYNENHILISEEVVGWYYGKPSTEATCRFVGKLKAEYEED